MTITSPHLTLAELASAGSTRPLPAAGVRHLAECGACQARSQAVAADGLRLLVSRCQPPPGLIDRVLAEVDVRPAPARHGRLRGRTGTARTRMAATATAAVILIGGGYGLAQALGSSGQLAAGTRPAAGGGTTAAALTATGCPGLDLAGGTLQRASDTDAVLATADGRQVTVTTSASTRIIREITGTLADITAGAHVFVTGTVSDGTVTARTVAIMPGLARDTPRLPSGGGLAAQLGLVTGTVTSVGSTGFTVTGQNGTRAPVTTTPSTSVITTVNSTLSQLREGKITSAAGTAGPGGTLAASSIEQADLPAGALRITPPALPPSLKGLPALPAMPKGLPSSLPAAGGRSPFTGFGCAPAAITSADLLVLMST